MKRHTIKNKLLKLNIAVIVVIFLFGASLFGTLMQIRNISTNIADSPLIMTKAASNIEVNVIKMHRAMKDVVLAQNDVERTASTVRVNSLEAEVFSDLEIIGANILGDEGKIIYEEFKKLFIDWKPIREEVLILVDSDMTSDAHYITTGKGLAHVQQLEMQLELLTYHFDSHVKESIAIIRDKTGILFLLFGITFTAALIIIFVLNTSVYRSILKRIYHVATSMKNMVKSGTYENIETRFDDEISELASSFNGLVSVTNSLLNHKDSISTLQKMMASVKSVEDLGKEYLEWSCKATAADYGIFYSLDFEKNKFTLSASHAVENFSDIDHEVIPGEGILGQAILDMKPKIIDGIKYEMLTLNLPNMKILPTNIYVFPIVFGKDDVLGVGMIAKVGEFTQNEMINANEARKLIGSYLFGIRQKDKISNLLNEAKLTNNELENTTMELESSSKELESINSELESNNSEMETINRLLEDQKRELESKTLALEESNKLKTEFLANMSHELRTPLNSIILLSDMLMKRASTSKEDLRKISVVNSAGRELLDLINNLLDISKIESGHSELFMETISTSDTGRRTRRKFEDLAIDKGLDFIVEDALGIEFQSDRVKLDQIIGNLVSNSIKFTQKGHVKLSFKKSDLDGYNICISVEDTGIGISKKKQQVIFEKFRQADGSVTREFGGTGLGLSICASLTSLLGGTIIVNSNIDEGSIFTLHLLTANKSIDNLSLSESVISKTSAELTDTIKYGDKFILVIEDDFEFASSLKPYINSQGYKVRTVSRGYEGLIAASELKPDGIILDLMLPDINGAKILKELKINPFTRGIPVHVLTVNDASKSLDLRKMGASGFTTKTPYVDEDARIVMDSIKKITSKHPKSLLIVEDDETEANSLKEMLTGWDLDVSTTDGVASAISMLKNGNFDAMVLDLKLKDGSGMEICTYIKENELDLPVIVYTAKSLTDEEYKHIKQNSGSLILKSANSKGNLLEEIAIFMHRVSDWQNGESLPVPGNSNNLKGKKILICDDDARNIFTLSSVFEEFGVQVHEAYNGIEALDILKTEKNFHLVLMDIMMPEMDGFEAIREIRKQKEYKKLPIIALTAKAMKGDRQNCLAAGASDYMSKPVDMAMLVKLSSMWVGD